jgi:hypothetical protein
MFTGRSTLTQQRRRQAAPLALLLLGWGLGAGPVMHAVVAHGDPVVHDGSARGWVDHAEGVPQSAPRETLPTHRHAPGSLEHLQLAMLWAAVVLVVAAMLRRVQRTVVVAWRAPVLARWRFPEVPCGP